MNRETSVEKKKTMSELERFKSVVAKLRDPETGCPWDRVQTMMSLRRYLIEEVGEYLDALEAGDFDAVKDEMGDLLMQVVLNCRIAEEEGKFTLEDVAKSEADKMIRRHPHVFQGVELKTEQERIDSWDKIKKNEKDDGRRSALDGVARAMPGLSRAQKVLDKAGRVGFEWADFNGAMAKVEEELAEVKEAAAADDAKALEEELGDLLFTVVNLCRWKNLQAEEVIHGGIRKFVERFKKMESLIHVKGSTPEEMMEAWRKAKLNAEC